MHKIEGKFRRVSETNYEAYLSAIGIGFAKRKMALVFTPEMEIKYDKDQDKWFVTQHLIYSSHLVCLIQYSFFVRTFITTTPVKDVVINFKLDQPFPESSVDGREVRKLIMKLRVSVTIPQSLTSILLSILKYIPFLIVV